MKRILRVFLVGVSCGLTARGQESGPALRSLDSGDFHMQSVTDADAWRTRREEIQSRVMLAAGLWPMPERGPVNAVVHGRVEKDGYTIDRVFFESVPGHFVTGSLFLPKEVPVSMPGILCPHGHFKDGRFYNRSDDRRAVMQELAIGAERFESAARAPLQARCVQLARMGCAVFHYDTLGNADSMQIPDHRSGARDHLKGEEPGSYGLYSAAAELRLQTNFGLQTYNSVRALDFLESLPGVDPKRLGVTGASGGGTQTLMLTAVDERVSAAFPCVMVSTSMQGGCTCENAPHLRIGQGNVDIAAVTAPRPLGLTAADDWTIELETKGFPDLEALYRMLGARPKLTALFATHFRHNYNHVSRTKMYGFFNEHFGLGFDKNEPVLERDFEVATRDELTVWTAEHPAPAGEATGEAHERAMLKAWAEMSDAVIEPLLRPEGEPEVAEMRRVVGRAWEMMIGDRAGKAEWKVSDERVEGPWRWREGTARLDGAEWEVPIQIVEPTAGGGDWVVWLAMKAPTAVDLKPLVDAGLSVVVPELYLRDAARAPSVNKEAVSEPNSWKAAACYTYGYNPSVYARRVQDALTVMAALREHSGVDLKSIRVLGVDGAGVVAAGAVGMAREWVTMAAVNTEGFRFRGLTSVWDVNFVPGAVKYGDVPALLALCAPVPMTLAGERETVAAAKATYSAVGSSALEHADEGDARAALVRALVKSVQD